MTEEYTVVQLNWQEELTRRIQEKLNQAGDRINERERNVAAPARYPSMSNQNYLALDSTQSNGCDGSIDQKRRSPMPTFVVDRENRIGIIRSEKGITESGEAFTSEQSLAKLAAKWPGNRLVQIWNAIPGVKPINRFTNRKIALDRIWKAIQPSGAVNTGRPKRGVREAAKRKRIQKARQNTAAVPESRKMREGSKTAVIVRLLQRPTGVTLKKLMAATGWQAHSVRGFISAGGKRRGLRVESSKRQDGQRVYQIR